MEFLKFLTRVDWILLCHRLLNKCRLLLFWYLLKLLMMWQNPIYSFYNRWINPFNDIVVLIAECWYN